MGLIDRISLGNIIKDFGVLDEKSLGLGRERHSAFLVEKQGRVFFVIKHSLWFFLSASVSYQKFALEDAAKIREYICESEQIARNLPPPSYDISSVSLRNMLISFAVATALNLLAINTGLALLVTFGAFIYQAAQYSEFRSHPASDSKIKGQLLLIRLITFISGAAIFLWPILVQLPSIRHFFFK